MYRSGPGHGALASKARRRHRHRRSNIGRSIRRRTNCRSDTRVSWDSLDRVGSGLITASRGFSKKSALDLIFVGGYEYPASIATIKLSKTHMPRLTIPDQSQAPKESQEILSEIGQMLGFVPNIQRVMARSPHVLEGWWSLRESLFKTLDANTRHAVALAASEVNGCNYCLAVHSQMAAKVGQLSSGEITLLREGKSSDPKRAAAAQFARQVVAKRGKVSDDDLASVKAAGFSEN